jgi:hypothetical protein
MGEAKISGTNEDKKGGDCNGLESNCWHEDENEFIVGTDFMSKFGGALEVKLLGLKKVFFLG